MMALTAVLSWIGWALEKTQEKSSRGTNIFFMDMVIV
jgi:hypothetical protein